jgi:MFS family permease
VRQDRAVTSAAGPSAAAPAHPLADPRFRWFFAGRTASLLSGAMVWVALTFAVLEASGSVADLSIVTAAYTVPLALFQVFGGAIGDRFPRDRVLVLSHLGGALVQGVMATLLLTGTYALPLFAGLAVLNGTLQAVAGPALVGIVPEVVPRPLVQKANSLLGGSRNAAKAVGPALSGVLVAGAGGGWAIAADAVAYAIAAFCMARLRLPGRVRPGNSVLHDLREGWAEFTARTWVWAASVVFAGINFLHAGAWGVLGPVLAEDTIGPTGWGLVLSANAVGLVASSVVMYRLSFERLLLVGHGCLVLAAVKIVLLGLGAPTALLVAGAFFSGAALGVYGIAYETSMHEHIPQEALSRVVAFDTLGAFVTVPLGQLAVVPAAAAFGDSRVVLVAGIGYAVLALAVLLVPSIRRLRHATT